MASYKYMAIQIHREELRKIADAFFSNNKQSLALYKNNSGKKFLEYLQSTRKDYGRKPRFELQGYPVCAPGIPPIGSEIHKNTLINRFLNEGDGAIQSSMTVAISYKCSQKCGHCYITEYRDSSRREMTVDEFKIAFNKIENEALVWHFDITGGEPLEHPDFFEIIKQIPPDRATAIVATNGLLIDKKMVSKIRHSNIMICKVGLDLYSGLNSYSMKKALSSIKMLTDNKVFTFAQVFLKRGFARQFALKDIIERCKKSGAALVHLISPMAIGNLKNHDELFFTDKERRIIYLLKRYYAFSHRYLVTVFPDWELIRFGCLAARGRIYINPYGDIYPCNFIPRRYGNILTDDLKRVILNMQKDIGKVPCDCYSSSISSKVVKRFQTQRLFESRRINERFIEDES